MSSIVKPPASLDDDESEHPFVCLVEPNKLEFSIVATGDEQDQDLLESTTSSDMNTEVVDGDSVLCLFLILFNPYNYDVNFSVACNNPSHYSLRKSKGTMEKQSETKM